MTFFVMSMYTLLGSIILFAFGSLINARAFIELSKMAFGGAFLLFVISCVFTMFKVMA